MENNKKLYFLHIPKTGGVTVMTNIYRYLTKHGISAYPPSPPPHDDDFDKYQYIQAHLGRYPLLKSDNIAIASLIRDPVERAISNFGYIYNRVLENRSDYLNIDKPVDKLRYYLFDDEFYFSHRNIQSQFICSQPEKNMFKDMTERNEEEYVTRSKNWYLQDVDLDIETVKKYVDEFEIVNTTNHVKEFIYSIIAWFNKNYGVPLMDSDTSIFSGNENPLTIDGVAYSTQDLKNELSDEDIEKILDLNSIDFELYEYVFDKENSR
jgi:hypothetical protein